MAWRWCFWDWLDNLIMKYAHNGVDYTFNLLGGFILLLLLRLTFTPLGVTPLSPSLFSSIPPSIGILFTVMVVLVPPDLPLVRLSSILYTNWAGYLAFMKTFILSLRTQQSSILWPWLRWYLQCLVLSNPGLGGGIRGNYMGIFAWKAFSRIVTWFVVNGVWHPYLCLLGRGWCLSGICRLSDLCELTLALLLLWTSFIWSFGLRFWTSTFLPSKCNLHLSHIGRPCC